MNVVKYTAGRVIICSLACCLQPIPESAMNDEQIDCVIDIILAAIDFAAELDLDRRP